MALWHLKSLKKPTGGKLSRNRKKMRMDRGSMPVDTRIGKAHVARKRSKGGNFKLRMSSAEFANVADPKTGKIKKAKIVTVKDNKANPHFVRRNIITKGAVIETDMGLARVTSRPGQDGIVNAILVEGKK